MSPEAIQGGLEAFCPMPPESQCPLTLAVVRLSTPPDTETMLGDHVSLQAWVHGPGIPPCWTIHTDGSSELPVNSSDHTGPLAVPIQWYAAAPVGAWTLGVSASGRASEMAKSGFT